MEEGRKGVDTKRVLLFVFIAAIVIAITLIVGLILVRPSTSHEVEVEDESEFSYQVGSDTGPKAWGALHEEWAQCKAGHMQSPIDLPMEKLSPTVANPGMLNISHRPAPAILVNRGHDIMIKLKGDAGGISIDGTEYRLKQFHWHSPSEHKVNGERFDLELHMVHVSGGKKIAVLGVLYKIGGPNPFLAKLEKRILSIRKEDHGKKEAGVVDPRDVLGRTNGYCRYVGSLTTPPCTEGVVWTVFAEAETVSSKQVKTLRDAVHDDFSRNARPTQPINQRELTLCRPTQ